MKVTLTNEIHEVKVGNHVRAWDHMPMPERPDRFVEGVVTNVDGDIITIHVLKDTVFPVGVRLKIKTHSYTWTGEYKERIQVLGALDLDTGVYKEK